MNNLISFICGLSIGSISIYLYFNSKLKVLNTEKEYIKSQLLERSDKDSLSGLYTNYYVMDYLEERIQHLNGRSLSVLLMDLDKFRIINDDFGHKYGDEVLRNQ
jgi:GGDEF domain-containing protein